MSTIRSSSSAFKTIASATIIAGALDILAAILIYSIIMEQTTPSRICMSIASGIFGKEAYSGGVPMVLTGLLLHFFIAFLFSTFYYRIFPYLRMLRKQKLVCGILYGIFVWLVMNVGVLRITFPKMPFPDPRSSLIGMSILIVAVGIPISYIISANRR
ncbi:DUF1440 domain-containing protein [Dyadobacter arcticus]|uniref:Membrane protein YagU involved in acid resistance n=1 Tax=Dyadobacter arcticus TaxID=1078754 RepID=A0ABX0UQE9_9BACT|nr:DUF1440 domain-containing protein [Dyadobacter arcticus]NIJ54174.1 putative membrane protein YagU involved in acid resistance [Dyadobacter arcticus]